MANLNLPPEVLETMTSFEEDFLTASKGLPSSWLDNTIATIKTLGPEFEKAVFPIPVSAAEYKAMTGTAEYRQLMAKFFEASYAEWQDGVTAKVTTLMSPMGRFTGWAESAAAFAQAAQTLEHKRAALALQTNATSWDGVAFFHTQHLINALDPSLLQYNDNTLYSMTVSNANFDRINDRFRGFRAPNGERMGLKFSGLLYGDDLATSIENLISPSSVPLVAPDGETNPYRWKGRVWGREAPELTVDGDYYAFATNRPDIKGIAGVRKMAPGGIDMNTGRVAVGGEIETIIDDMSSELYKHGSGGIESGSVAIGKRKRFEARLGHHLAIIRCRVAAS
jgi:hypothetical protein